MRSRYAARSAVVLFALTCADLSGAAAQTALRTAAECTQLRALRLAHTTIAVAQPLAGSFVAPGARDTIRNLPALCRVAGSIHPTADSDIRFEVWLPLENWNGNFAGVGNGGWGGTISYDALPYPAAEPATLADQARRGYAVASTNTGHVGTPFNARFVTGHPERLVDFASRAVHETTIAAKAVSAAFYGRPPRHAYWIGCSTGGRQGLVEAQRFPSDYDGIVAGAPASDWLPIATSSLDHTIAALGDSSRYLPPAALALLEGAVMKACDRLDGVEDGLLEDPRKCRFDPAALRCGSGAASAPANRCLTSGQIDAVDRIYGGVVDPTNGRRIAPGLERGSELGWAAWATPGDALPLPITDYQWLVFADSTWDWRSFDLANPRDHTVWAAADRRLTPILSAIDPDLRAFRTRGGKLIEYHGWSDPLIAPQFSIDYYDSVVAQDSTAGEARGRAIAAVQRFYRMFMVPGMGHCGGGDGPNTFDMERALANWVEHDVAPASVVASHRGRGGVPGRERPMCPYPETAVYNGAGDVNRAASFACRDGGVPERNDRY